MNATELKARAQRIANRLNALGFTKGGQPMVIDQAYELVAAEEGYRNQHALRAVLASLILKPGRHELLGMDLDDLSALADGLESGYEKTVNVGPAIEQGIDVLIDSSTTVAARFIRQAIAEARKQLAYPLALHIPRTLDKAFAEAVLVQRDPDESDIEMAHEAWRLIVEEAEKRASRTPVTSESEQEAEQLWAQLCTESGWNEDSQIVQLLGFLRDNWLMTTFASYAKKAAEDESADAGFNCDIDEVPVPAAAVSGHSSHCVDCGKTRGTHDGHDGRCADCWMKDSVPVVNTETYALYSYELARLARHDLEDLVKAAQKDLHLEPLETAHWSEADLRSFLLRSYEKMFCRAAEQAFETYDFGDDIVESHSGAEHCVQTGFWRKPVFLRKEGDEGDSRKVDFTVFVFDLKATGIEVYKVIEG